MFFQATAKTIFFVILILGASHAHDNIDRLREVPLSDPPLESCASNGVVSSWCDNSAADVECMLDTARNLYMCQCPGDPSLCPDECIRDSDLLDQPIRTHRSILCHGIPRDEPNYILRSDKSLPLHHCESNGIVANWCSEATSSGVSCLLLPALDEYVCTCHWNSAYCPSECVEGSALGRKTKHAIRCQGIPVDTPNYILE